MASNEVANIQNFGGRVLKKKTRDKITKQRERLYKSSPESDSSDGYMRDNEGRIMLTGPERELLRELVAKRKSGEIKYQKPFP